MDTPALRAASRREKPSTPFSQMIASAAFISASF
jgi:hypothetical protein